MNRILLSFVTLGALAAGSIAQAASVRVGLGDGRVVVRDHEYDRGFYREDGARWGPSGWEGARHEHGARLIETTRRVMREDDGDKVIVTRRVYEDRDGDRFVRVNKTVIDD